MHAHQDKRKTVDEKLHKGLQKYKRMVQVEELLRVDFQNSLDSQAIKITIIVIVEVSKSLLCHH